VLADLPFLGGPSTSPLGIIRSITILIVIQGDNVTKRLSRIAPWQAGKLFALIYFFLSLLFVIPMLLVSTLVPMPAGPGPRLGPLVLVLFPFLYALAGLIFVPWVAGYTTSPRALLAAYRYRLRTMQVSDKRSRGREGH
jgi:hypothetical protein